MLRRIGFFFMVVEAVLGADLAAAAVRLEAIASRDGARLGPGEALFTDPVEVRAEGFAPGARVTLVASDGAQLSRAEFQVGDSGVLSTAVDAPSAGTYSGVDPDGLFWSMGPADPASPDDPLPSGSPFHVEISARESGAEVARAVLQRTALLPGVRQMELTGDGLVGALYLPAPGPGGGLPPVVITLGGSEGGSSSARYLAAELAGHGIAGLAIGYFGEPGLPPELSQVPLEIIERAIAYLRARADVDATRIGIEGGSRGGELALLAGARFPEIAATVALVPSDLVWGAPDPSGAAREVSSWTWRGEDLPFVSSHGAQPSFEPMPGGGFLIDYVQMFIDALGASTDEELAGARIPAERSIGRVLALGGEADHIWPSCRFVRSLGERLRAAGREGDEAACYAGAGHDLAAGPGFSTLARAADEGQGQMLAYGGLAAATAHAQRAAFGRALAFLRETLR